jgi:AraC family transcriptional regulator, regulatory protein of adaptative response / DNA-3-methyladenine glycosylase II
VRFYMSASAAEAAGFRACRRCRPESAPGSPDWNVRADLVGRALRLIAEGAIDRIGIDGLARRLAVSSRHLHRELSAAVGAGPLALARTRRAQTARLLIDQTPLSLTEVAFAAGFRSVRQFNETMQAAFGCPPSELRRRERPVDAGQGAVVLRLRYRPPLAAEALLAHFARRALPSMEAVADGVYRRTVTLGRSVGVVEIEAMANSNDVLVRLHLDDLRDLGGAVQRCRQLFDLEVDPGPVAETLGVDPVLRSLITARPGLRVPGAFDGWELAARAVLGQQVSLAGARTIANRLVVALGTPLPAPVDGLTHLFPPPAAVAGADLAGLGIMPARRESLRALARAVASGGLVLDQGANREETVRQLEALPGIGPWTSAYVAMRALGDPDAFPVADLALRRAATRLGLGENVGTLQARAETWRPWRSYAAMYLWNSLTTTAP